VDEDRRRQIEEEERYRAEVRAQFEREDAEAGIKRARVAVVPADDLEEPSRGRLKIGAAIVGGFLAAFLASFVLSFLGVEAVGTTILIGWVVFGLIFLRSGWPTVWASLSIMSFLWPVAVFIMGASAGDYSSDAAAAGSAIGVAMTTGIAGTVGLFLGLMFAIIAFFTQRAKTA
jgi:hypothetical protein